MHVLEWRVTGYKPMLTVSVMFFVVVVLLFFFFKALVLGFSRKDLLLV